MHTFNIYLFKFVKRQNARANECSPIPQRDLYLEGRRKRLNARGRCSEKAPLKNEKGERSRGAWRRGSKGCEKIWQLRFNTTEREMESGENHWEIAEKKDREELYPGGRKEDLSHR